MSGTAPTPPTGTPDAMLALQAQLAAAQAARFQIISGQKPAVVLYSQGDGTKSVTYTRANLTYLDAFIATLTRQITGLNPRRALGFNFGSNRRFRDRFGGPW